MDSIFNLFFSDRIYRINGIFFACGNQDALRPKALLSSRSCKSCLIILYNKNPFLSFYFTEFMKLALSKREGLYQPSRQMINKV